jgi:hypothetical protein
MYKLLIISTFLLLFACKKKEEATPTVTLNNNPTTTDLGTLLTKGSFMNNAHTVSGTAKVYEKDSKRTLVFETFNTDNGPDLRVYLSKDSKASDFVELGKLQSTNGNFNYSIPASANADEYKFVLIWCKQFSVLFGNAELKK